MNAGNAPFDSRLGGVLMRNPTEKKETIRQKAVNNPSFYQEMLRQEAEAWSAGATDLVARFGEPDYLLFRNIIYHRVYRGEFITKELRYVKPGMKVLELGCASGWFSLELWRRGANVDAVDIAHDALEIAKQYYDKIRIREKRSNRIRYILGDANYIEQVALAPPYDLVFARGVLHHLPRCTALCAHLPQLMREDSLLIVDDAASTYKYQEHLNAFNTIFLCYFIGGALRKRFFIRTTLKMLIRSLSDYSYAHSIVHAHKASPFESITEGKDIDTAIEACFYIDRKETFGAFIGSLTCAFDRYSQRLQDILVPVLRLLNVFDKLVIKMGIAKGGILFIVAKPRVSQWESI